MKNEGGGSNFFTNPFPLVRSGATMACEANTAGAGFCIGELNMEEGSRLLYDSGLGCKPAWYAVRSALRHRAIGGGTGIGDVPALQPNATIHPFYDLQGRRVTNGHQPSAPDLYIHNGRKLMVK